jgi:hypothetical protein
LQGNPVSGHNLAHLATAFTASGGKFETDYENQTFGVAAVLKLNVSISDLYSDSILSTVSGCSADANKDGWVRLTPGSWQSALGCAHSQAPAPVQGCADKHAASCMRS